MTIPNRGSDWSSTAETFDNSHADFSWVETQRRDMLALVGPNPAGGGRRAG